MSLMKVLFEFLDFLFSEYVPKNKPDPHEPTYSSSYFFMSCQIEFTYIRDQLYVLLYVRRPPQCIALHKTPIVTGHMFYLATLIGATTQKMRNCSTSLEKRMQQLVFLIRQKSLPIVLGEEER